MKAKFGEHTGGGLISRRIEQKRHLVRNDIVIGGSKGGPVTFYWKCISFGFAAMGAGVKEISPFESQPQIMIRMIVMSVRTRHRAQVQYYAIRPQSAFAKGAFALKDVLKRLEQRPVEEQIPVDVGANSPAFVLVEPQIFYDVPGFVGHGV